MLLWLPPVSLILMGIFFFEIYTKNEPPSFVEDPSGSLWLCLFLILASGSFLALSRISYKAGFDLWRWKNRGRKPAYIAMMLFLCSEFSFFSSARPHGPYSD